MAERLAEGGVPAHWRIFILQAIAACALGNSPRGMRQKRKDGLAIGSAGSWASGTVAGRTALPAHRDAPSMPRSSDGRGDGSTAEASEAGGVRGATLPMPKASGHDTPRASLSAISSAVSRHDGYRSAMGRASSLLMICLASWLRPTADISTARLFK